ncbi:MAG: glycine zipper 2TM domain-containing protein [Campylobacter sp.]|nr:glycine zipper 2TM domain-containing protein [Campylobacter sp.]
MKKLSLMFILASSLAFAKTVDIKVVESIPVYETVTTTETRCNEEWDENNILGTAIGATAGGVLGSRIGGGSGKTAATIAGTILGGAAGNRVQNSTKDKGGCKDYPVKEKKFIGYKNVGYYDGREYTKNSTKKLNTFKVNVK